MASSKTSAAPALVIDLRDRPEGYAPRPINREQLRRRDERQAVREYRDKFAVRLLIEFMISLAAWVGLVWAGFSGVLPLWVAGGLLIPVATTFYMAMHEATHGNIWGAHQRGRWLQGLIGAVASVPLGFDFFAHRISHIQHHAHTNDPERDPDFYTTGRLRDLPITWLGSMLALTILPLLLFVPATVRLLPGKVRGSFTLTDEVSEADLAAGKAMLRYWALFHTALVLGFVFGFGWKLVVLWFIPARIAPGWLQFVFAWLPHHPVARGRYVDTRVATFPGSRILLRGHDHHALHHLFPRVPHYYLPRIWQEVGPDLVEQGVRSEGTALGATGPIVW